MSNIDQIKENQIRIKGNYFAEPNYFRTDVKTGLCRTPSGQRICTLPPDFLLGLRDALIYECGKSYRQVLKSAGDDGEVNGSNVLIVSYQHIIKFLYENYHIQ